MGCLLFSYLYGKRPSGTSWYYRDPLWAEDVKTVDTGRGCLAFRTLGRMKVQLCTYVKRLSERYFLLALTLRGLFLIGTHVYSSFRNIRDG